MKYFISAMHNCLKGYVNLLFRNVLSGCCLKRSYPYLLILYALFVSIPAGAQGIDHSWWNELHGWKEGMPSWKRWIKISPGYLGPNALPVPEAKKGYNLPDSEVSFAVSSHFHPGDPTQDISGRLYLPFADGAIAFETYGVIIENYAFTDAIRDERIARDKDGRGVTQGDFYFSTLIQISKDRKFPNTLFRIAGRTASGGAYKAARYSDNPGYFFDFSFSKDYHFSRSAVCRPFASLGFYSWQTNNENTFQNDAPFYSAGLELETGNWMMSGNFSGYSGYQFLRDRPQVVNLHFRHDWETSAASLDLISGLRHWEYQTIKFTYAWKFSGL